MPIAAWAIPTVIGAGVSLYGTHKQASAAKDAAGQQMQAANQAKAELAPIHQQNVARMDPYANLGASAVGSLSSLMGYPAAAPPTGYGASGQPLGPMTGQQGPMNMSDPRVQHLAQGGSLADMVGGRSFSGGPTGTAVPRTASSYAPLSSLGTGVGGGAMRSGGGMVRLQAPTGEVGEFPEEQAQMFVQAGAKRLS